MSERNKNRVRVNDSDIKKIKVEAAKRGISMGELVSLAIKALLKK